MGKLRCPNTYFITTRNLITRMRMKTRQIASAVLAGPLFSLPHESWSPCGILSINISRTRAGHGSLLVRNLIGLDDMLTKRSPLLGMRLQTTRHRESAPRSAVSQADCLDT